MPSWTVLTPFKQQSSVVHSSCAALSSKQEVIRSGPSSVALRLMQFPGTCAPFCKAAHLPPTQLQENLRTQIVMEYQGFTACTSQMG